MSRIRKAIMAAAGAFASAVLAAVVEGGAPNGTEAWAGLLLGALVAAVTVGAATYKIRNEGTVNGSDAAGGAGVYRAS